MIWTPTLFAFFLSALAPSVAAADDQEDLGRTIGEIMDAAPETDWVTPSPNDLLYLDTEEGQIIVLLTSHLAPAHRDQLRTLAAEDYYDGLSFYRVVHGFVAQGGDESGERPKGSAAEQLTAEFEEPMRPDIPFTPLGFDDGYADEAGFIDGIPAGRDLVDGTVWLAHCTGAFAFGRENERDTASTEVYITLQPHRYLDRNLTVVGRVIYGMDTVQSIPRGALGNSGTIEDEDRWTRINDVSFGSALSEDEGVSIQYLDTNSQTFRDLIKARSARPSPFFHYRHHYMDLCQMPLPVRVVSGD